MSIFKDYRQIYFFPLLIYKKSILSRRPLFDILWQEYPIIYAIIYCKDKKLMICHNGISDFFLGIREIGRTEKIWAITPFYIVVYNPF